MRFLPQPWPLLLDEGSTGDDKLLACAGQARRWGPGARALPSPRTSQARHSWAARSCCLICSFQSLPALIPRSRSAMQVCLCPFVTLAPPQKFAALGICTARTWPCQLDCTESGRSGRAHEVSIIRHCPVVLPPFLRAALPCHTWIHRLSCEQVLISAILPSFFVGGRVWAVRMTRHEMDNTPKSPTSALAVECAMYL